MTDWIEAPDFGFSTSMPSPDSSKPSDIEVVTFFERNYACSCLVFDSPGGDLISQGWIFGSGNTPVFPVYVYEFAILHSLPFLLRELKGEEMNFAPATIHVRARRNLDCHRLLRWFNEGFFGLQSAAGSALIGIIGEHMEVLPCHPVLSSSEGGTRFKRD